MALPDFSMRQLLEAGVHFGHQAHRWNPKMARVHLRHPQQHPHRRSDADGADAAPGACRRSATRSRKGGRILFVGTKRQAQDAIAEAAKKSRAILRQFALARRHADQLEDVSNSIKRLRTLDEMLASNEAQGYTKKERLTLQRERDKLDRALGGIKDMGGLPDLVFVIDTNKEDIAIKEARRLNVPVAAVVDTNCDPDGITFVVPGNDDASRAITLYCDLIAKAAIDGISRGQGEHGIDRRRRWPSRSPRRCRPRADGLGFEPLSGPRGVADDLKKLARRVAGDREEAQRSRHLPLSGRSPNSSPTAAHNIGEEVGLARPRRRLDCQGEGAADGRGRVRLARALLGATRSRNCIAALGARRIASDCARRHETRIDSNGEHHRTAWSRSCATRPARA